MNNGDDSHAMVGIIDPVDHAIGATTGTVSIIKCRTELLTDALRIVEQRPDNVRQAIPARSGQLPT
jgi:hypothetical protein